MSSSRTRRKQTSSPHFEKDERSSAAAGPDIQHNFCSPGRTWNTSAPPSAEPGWALYCLPGFALPTAGALKAENAETADTPESPRLPFSLRFPAPKLALARLQPALAGRRNRRQPRVGMRSAASRPLGPVCTTFRVDTFLVFAHLPPPFRFCASGLLPGCCSCSSARLRLLPQTRRKHAENTQSSAHISPAYLATILA